MFIMTMDQRASSGGPDRVETLVAGLNEPAPPHQGGILRPFQRTAGDEVQGVVVSADLVVGIALSAARSGHWSVGIGVGPVRRPLPTETRAGAGPAFESARRAVERSKHSPGHVAVDGPDELDSLNSADRDQVVELLEALEAGLQLLAELEARRTPEGQEAGRYMDEGQTQREAAEALGVSQQAVSSRLRSGLWGESRRLAAASARLLDRLDRMVDDRHETVGGE